MICVSRAVVLKDSSYLALPPLLTHTPFFPHLRILLLFFFKAWWTGNIYCLNNSFNYLIQMRITSLFIFLPLFARSRTNCGQQTRILSLYILERWVGRRGILGVEGKRGCMDILLVESPWCVGWWRMRKKMIPMIHSITHPTQTNLKGTDWGTKLNFDGWIYRVFMKYCGFFEGF